LSCHPLDSEKKIRLDGPHFRRDIAAKAL